MAVINIPKVCNDNRNLFCHGVETTQDKKSSSDPVYHVVCQTSMSTEKDSKGRIRIRLEKRLSRTPEKNINEISCD